MTKLKTLAAALVTAFAVPAAFAAIAPGTTGNGELFLSVFDDAAKLSYTLDLGVTQNTFFTGAQLETGSKYSWVVNDAAFQSFLGQVTPANLQWSVLAIDSTGGTAVGAYRLFNTVRAGDESLVSTAVNGKYFNGMGTSQAGTFFNAVNTTGTHGTPGVPLDYAVNGSSVNADSDAGNAYYGNGSVGLSTTLNNNLPFNMANAVGTASSFYYITRSGTDQNAAVAVDQFNNSQKQGSFLLSAAPGLTGASSYSLSYALAPIPEPQTYALMLAGLVIVSSIARRRFNG
jgi:hypothetical protein